MILIDKISFKGWRAARCEILISPSHTSTSTFWLLSTQNVGPCKAKGARGGFLLQLGGCLGQRSKLLLTD